MNVFPLPLDIVQDDKKYLLVIIIKEEKINFIIHPENIENKKYSKAMNLNEIKVLHKIFLGLNSCKEFCDYIKAL